MGAIKNHFFNEINAIQDDLIDEAYMIEEEENERIAEENAKIDKEFNEMMELIRESELPSWMLR